MRGEVLSFDAASGSGWISGADGVRYGFTTADLAAPVPVHPGAVLDFVPVGGAATQIMPAPGFAAQAAPTASGGMFSPVTPDPVGEPDLSVWGYTKKCMRKYADFNGRARRKEYWSFILVEFALSLPLYAVGFGFFMAAIASSPSSNGSTSELSPAGAAMMLVAGLFFLVLIVIRLALLLPTYALFLRRFHDIGISGWWLLAAFVPILSIGLIVVPFIPSQPGANIYGGYPKPVT